MHSTLARGENEDLVVNFDLFRRIEHLVSIRARDAYLPKRVDSAELVTVIASLADRA